MLATLVAAAALAVSAPDPAAGFPVNVVASTTDLPRFVERPSSAAFASVYPHGAASVGMGGRAVLHCTVQSNSRLEKCQVADEVPVGAGFGAAALSLAHYFRLDPSSDAAHAANFDLPIGFAIANSDAELPVAGPWLAAPTFGQVAAVYPDIGGGVAGQVVMHCAVEPDGGLKACKLLYERPSDREFDAAALKLTRFFRMQVDPAYLKARQPLATTVLVRMAAPFGDEAKQRRIGQPVWLTRLDEARLAQLFPAQAAVKGVVSGVGYADCTVAADGALTACHPFAGEPADLGFSEAAAKAATALRMSPWTEDGGPVDGANVRVPIRFSRGPAPALASAH
jgi:hypothetical protein